MPPVLPRPAPQLPADALARFEPATTRWVPGNARTLVYVADLAYEPDPGVITATAVEWGFPADRVSIIQPATSVLQAIVLGGKDAILVAFRGTRPDQIADWVADAGIMQEPFTKYFAASAIGATHSGFTRLLASGWPLLRSEILRFQDAGQPIWVTGHSLGGSLAVLATAALTFAERLPVNGLYTFGQPRVGDPLFCTQCDAHFGSVHFRFVNDKDIVTRVPPRIVPGLPLPGFYGHSGTLRYFDSKGRLHADEHWWNAFLLDTPVGLDGVARLKFEAVADHDLLGGYAANVEKYLRDLAAKKQPKL